MSRDKGATGEREVVNLAKSKGIYALRTAPLQAGRADIGDVSLMGYPELHVEVKRDERMSVDAMVRQATASASICGVEFVPVVAYRRNKQIWRAVTPLDHYLDLVHFRSQYAVR